MSANPFATPAPPGDGIKWADYLGALLLIEPKAYEPSINTSFGETDAVRADVTILDGNNPGEEHLDTLIFPRLLVSQTKTKINEKVLGRLSQGVAKPGQSSPWLLQEATEQDVATGVAYLNSRQGAQIAQPAPAQDTQQQPAQQPAQQQPQQGQQGWPQQQPQPGTVPFGSPV